MVPVTEPRCIYPNPVNAHLKTLAYNVIKRSISRVRKINCLHNERPVHGFIAIEQVALENESQDIFVMTCMNVNFRRKKF